MALALIGASAVVIGLFGDRLRSASPVAVLVPLAFTAVLVVGFALPAQRHQPERTLLVLELGGATAAQPDRRGWRWGERLVWRRRLRP